LPPQPDHACFTNRSNATTPQADAASGNLSPSILPQWQVVGDI